MYIRWYKKKVGEVSYLGFRNKNTILSEILIFGYSELCVYRSRLLGTGSRAPGALLSAASCAAAGPRRPSPPRRAALGSRLRAPARCERGRERVIVLTCYNNVAGVFSRNTMPASARRSQLLQRNVFNIIMHTLAYLQWCIQHAIS